jgi:DNA polymerase III gamma/tau subunit
MANDVTAQVRDKLVDIIIAVLTRECEDFDGESVRRLIYAELESTPMTFALEKHAAVSKTKTAATKTKVVELDADGNPVKKVRTPKEPKEKAPKAPKEPKAPKAILTEEEREARKAEKEAAKEAAKEARKAEKAAAKDADKEAAKEAAKAEKAAAKEAEKAAKQAERDAVKAAKKAEKEAAEPVAKPVKEQRIPMPWCGKRIDGRCEALRAYHGLFAQCTADATETSMFCTSCEKTCAQFGTVAMRAACDLFDYTAPNGKKCVRLANVVDKFEVEGGIDAFVAEAAKHGITIPAEHLEKEVKQRGRPKSTSPRASTATKIATSDTGSGSETETDDEEYQAKKQAKQQQRKKVTKTAADKDAAPKKRGRPAKAKEPIVEPKDSLIQDLVASAKKSASATPTPKAATPATPATSTPELIEDEMIITTPISSPAAVVAPAAPKKAASASIKPKAAPKPVRKVVELDGDKFWEESFEGMDLYVRCSDYIAFDRSTGNGAGTWDDKTKTLIEDDESDADDEE